MAKSHQAIIDIVKNRIPIDRFPNASPWMPRPFYKGNVQIVSFSLLLVLSNMPTLRRQREIREGHQLTLGTTFTAVPEGVTDESYAASWSTTAPKYAVSLD